MIPPVLSDWVIIAVVALVAASCAAPRVPARDNVADAYCEAHVRGKGAIDIERVYLPRVVACEHSAASDAALRAQAIAARSYLYYQLDRVGWIRDGQRDQVFSCSREPSERHQRAVLDTAFEVMTHREVPIAGFYVSGALPRWATCRGSKRDPDRTERHVTYNEGRRGQRVRKTSLGGGSSTANRGAMSQRGADCLAKRGWEHERILRYYYGADIEIGRAEPATCHAQQQRGFGSDVGMTVWSTSGAAALFAALFWLSRRVRRRS